MGGRKEALCAPPSSPPPDTFQPEAERTCSATQLTTKKTHWRSGTMGKGERKVFRDVPAPPTHLPLSAPKGKKEGLGATTRKGNPPRKTRHPRILSSRSGEGLRALVRI